MFLLCVEFSPSWASTRYFKLPSTWNEGKEVKIEKSRCKRLCVLKWRELLLGCCWAVNSRERERKTLCRVVVCVESCVVATLCVRAGGGGGWWRSLRGRIRKFVVSKSIISFTVCVYGRRPLLCFFLSLLVVIFRLYFFEGRKNGGQMASVCLTYFKL